METGAVTSFEGAEWAMIDFCLKGLSGPCPVELWNDIQADIAKLAYVVTILLTTSQGGTSAAQPQLSSLPPGLM